MAFVLLYLPPGHLHCFSLLKTTLLGNLGSVRHLTLIGILRKGSQGLYGKTECATTPTPGYCSSSVPLTLSIMCFVEKITEQVCLHKDNRSHPTQSFSPWLMAKATLAANRAGVGGRRARVCVCVSASVSVSVHVGSLLSSQDHSIVALKPWNLHMWGLRHLNVPLPVALWASAWNDHFNAVKRWPLFLFITYYWTLWWSVLSLPRAIMQMLVPRWRCVSACGWFVWDEWVWEERIAGTFLMA